MAEGFELLPDGSGQFVEYRPGPYTASPPVRVVLKTVEAATVEAIRKALIEEQAVPAPPVAVPLTGDHAGDPTGDPTGDPHADD